jgi:flagellar assembly protein FliH
VTEIIITPERVQYHKVAKYSFRNFDHRRGEREQVVQPAAAFISDSRPRPAMPAAQNSQQPEASQGPQESRPTESRSRGESSGALSEADRQAITAIRDRQAEESGMVQQLVKKVEDFSDNIVKLQMRLEKQEEDFQARLEEAKKHAYEEGQREGQKQTASELTAQIEAQKEQFTDSVKKLDQALAEFEQSAGSLEKELSSIAMEIAHEVIAKEVSKEGDEISLKLAQSLMAQVKEAMKIQLKVHPEHASTLQNAFNGDERIKVVPDRAVSPGGVVIMSDAGNINGEIQHRFNAVKKSILEGAPS